MNRREFLAAGVTAGAVAGAGPAREGKSNRPKFRMKYAPHFGMFENSPSVKILDDLYHQQVSEGNLIPNMDMAWSEIGYFQIGDNPGRDEPGSGEINDRDVFNRIHEKGYTGVLGMEHGVSGKGKEGEATLFETYRYCDGF